MGKNNHLELRSADALEHDEIMKFQWRIRMVQEDNKPKYFTRDVVICKSKVKK